MAARRAGELAAKQSWTIARRQLLAVGISAARIRSWLARGRLHHRLPGVYAWGRPALGERGELAASLLYAGHGAGLTGLSALWWQQLLPHRPDATHIDAPGRRRSRPGLRILHPVRIERHEHRNLPVVALPRALLVAAPALSHDALRRVLARADFQHLLDLTSLHAAIRDGPAGSRAIRAALGAHLPQLARCVNDFECDFVLLCERFGLPIPEPNERIGRYRPDMLWRGAMLIVELDGGDGHTSPAQLLADADRQRWLEKRGYMVIRFSWAEVQFQPGWVAAAVGSALGL